MTYPMLFTDNLFSWRRVGMIANLYMPALRRGIICVAVVPALLVFIGGLIAALSGSVPSMILWWPIYLLLYASPIMLTRRDFRSVSAQLPVTASEKAAFLALTFFVGVPLIAFGSIYVGQLICIATLGAQVGTMLDSYSKEAISLATSAYGMSFPFICFISYLNIISVTAVALYYAATNRRNRTLTILVAVLVVIIAVSVICGLAGGIAGVIYAFNGGPEPMTMINADAGPEVEISRSFLKLTMIIATASWVLQEIVGIVFFYKLYKNLRNSGF